MSMWWLQFHEAHGPRDKDFGGQMNIMLTLAKIYCFFNGHDMWFTGQQVRGRTGRIGYRCLNGCGLESPQIPGKDY